MNQFSWRSALNAPKKTEHPFSTQCIEAAVYWNETCLKLEQFDMAADRNTRFCIGETPACDFMVSKEFISDSQYTLLNIVNDTATVNIPAFTGGTVRQGDIIEPFEESRTIRVHSLMLHGEVCCQIGPFRFVFKRTMKEPVTFAGMGLNFIPGRWTFISVAAHAVFFVLVGLVPPEVSGMNFDDMMQHNRMTKFIITAAQSDDLPPVKVKPKENTEGNPGKAQAGTIGKAGDVHARRTDKRIGIAGPPLTRDPAIGKELLKQIPRNRGIIDLLANNRIVSPWGEDTTIGRDPENALGNLVGNDIGSSFGYGGMGVNGPGRGGGGDTNGVIGVSDLGFGRFGHDAAGHCTGPLCTFSGGRPLKDTGTIRSNIHIRSEAHTVSGSLPKEVIRRFIRQKIREIRFCYERELAANTTLSGRVAIMFQINSQGGVILSAVKESTLRNPNVETCIASVVRRITFPPPPDGGTVIVTYPFNLIQSGN